MPRTQGPGQQGRKRCGDSGVGQRQRRGEAALAAQQVQRPQPVPQRVQLGPHRAGQACAAARGPALDAVHVGQHAGQLVITGRPAGQDDQQRGFADGDREVGLRSVVGPDKRRGADVPPGRRVRGHQLARLGQHQAGPAAPDGAHLALRHAAQGVQREHVHFLAQRADQLLPPAERVHRLGDQGRRDVVAGGQAQPLVRVAEQPAQRGQRVVGQRGRVQQPRDEAAGQPGSLSRAAVRPGVDTLRADPAEPGVRARRAIKRGRAIRRRLGFLAGLGRQGQRHLVPAGQPAVDQIGAPGPPAAGADAQLAGGEGQFQGGRAGVVGRALLRAHDRSPGQQVGVGRRRVRLLDGLGVGGYAFLVPVRVGSDDLLGPRRRADPRVAIQARQQEQATESLGHPDPARCRHRPLDRERVPQELLQAQQRDRLQAFVTGQPGQGGLGVAGRLGVLTGEGLQRLALGHHAHSLPQADARG
jgi:hypothetical protein